MLDTGVYHGGLIDRRSGHLHPLNLCMGEARAAASLGVKIFENTLVTDFGGGAKPFAATARGRVEAASIVLAGDAHHNFKRGKLRGLMFPTGSYIIATEPLPAEVRAAVNPHRRMFVDTKNFLFYWRLSPDGHMVFGARRSLSPVSIATARDFLHESMVRVHPVLAGVPVTHAWGGHVAITFDRIPQAGVVISLKINFELEI